MKKGWLVAGMAVVLSFGVCQTALAGWQQSEAGWQYQTSQGAYIAGEWFQDTESGLWYHFDANGMMQTGWIQDGGNSYYLDHSGAMLTNTTTPDGYQVDAQGVWIQNNDDYMATGWRQDSTGWWYQTVGRHYVKDRWKEIDGSTYYFNSDGYILTGFQTIDGNDYYFKPSGALMKRNFVLDGEAYIVDSEGIIENVVDEWDYYNDDDYDYSGSYRIDNDSYDDSDKESDTSDSGWEADEDGFDREAAEEVVDMVNEERTSRGLEPLEINEELMDACEIRSEEIVEKFSHTRPDGEEWRTAIEGSWRVTGENIAMGQTSPKNVMNSWMNSSGHKANILNKNYREIGVGCYIENGTRYWVQLFGRS